ncbi:hypothetical protein B0H19DRAFT_1079596 [Mycena capillaripes]|nr:hypothetical protein B0H19DRAFT_1079596 [Mycena capillaripes]
MKRWAQSLRIVDQLHKVLVSSVAEIEKFDSNELPQHSTDAGQTIVDPINRDALQLDKEAAKQEGCPRSRIEVVRVELDERRAERCGQNCKEGPRIGGRTKGDNARLSACTPPPPKTRWRRLTLATKVPTKAEVVGRPRGEMSLISRFSTILKYAGELHGRAAENRRRANKLGRKPPNNVGGVANMWLHVR